MFTFICIEPLNKEKLTLSGWGQIDMAGTYSDNLLTATLKQADDFSECQKVNLGNLQMSQHLCAQGEQQDSCLGDSGGKVRLGKVRLG
jgi:hypothetical protein